MLRVSASAEIGAPAAGVYRLIADYHDGHTRIVPPRYFRNLRVDQGGYGDGTLIRNDMLAFGTTTHARARVSEPTPGRVLVETDLDRGAVTTFTVDSLGAARCRVTITTDLPVRTGFLGAIERAVSRSYLSRVYAAELLRIDEQAREKVVTDDRSRR